MNEPVGAECVRRRTAETGLGVFAARSFEVGEVVLKGATVNPASGNSSHAVQIGPNEFGHEEGVGSLVNHSCDPNCSIRPSGEEICDLVARRMIRRGEQITIDYATRNFVIEFFPPWCRCGSPLCRGQITGWKDLSPERREAYGRGVAPYLFEMEREDRSRVNAL